MGGLAELRAVFMGPARYEPRSGWGPVSALVLTALAFIGAATVTVILGAAAGESFGGRAWEEALGPETGEAMTPQAVLLIEGVFVVLMLCWLTGVWVIAGRRVTRSAAFALDKRPPPLWVCLLVSSAVVAAVVAFDAATEAIVPHEAADAETAIAGLKTPFWWVTVFSIVVVAPIAEELIFRGFLLSSLAQSRLGVAGGGVISNAIWTLLHGYSIPGLASVFLMGLALTWLVWRSGSIYLAIIAHALNNVVALTLIYAFHVAP